MLTVPGCENTELSTRYIDCAFMEPLVQVGGTIHTGASVLSVLQGYQRECDSLGWERMHIRAKERKASREDEMEANTKTIMCLT